MYAISRLKAARNAWCWRVHFKRRGKLYSRDFYDFTSGGKKAAKEKAIAWRDERLAELKTFSVLEFYKQKRSNNISGVPSVHFHKTTAQPRGFWQASLRLPNGKRFSKSFSVMLHGNKAAFELAVAARTELLTKVVDKPYLIHPVAKRITLSHRSTAKTKPE